MSNASWSSVAALRTWRFCGNRTITFSRLRDNFSCPSWSQHDRHRQWQVWTSQSKNDQKTVPRSEAGELRRASPLPLRGPRSQPSSAAGMAPPRPRHLLSLIHSIHAGTALPEVSDFHQIPSDSQTTRSFTGDLVLLLNLRRRRM